MQDNSIFKELVMQILWACIKSSILYISAELFAFVKIQVGESQREKHRLFCGPPKPFGHEPCSFEGGNKNPFQLI